MPDALTLKMRLERLASHYAEVIAVLPVSEEGLLPDEELIATVNLAFFLLLFAQVEACVVWKVRQSSEDVYQTLYVDQRPLAKGGGWGFKGLVDWLASEHFLPAPAAEKIIHLYDRHRNPLAHGRAFEDMTIRFDVEWRMLKPLMVALLS